MQPVQEKLIIDAAKAYSRVKIGEDNGKYPVIYKHAIEIASEDFKAGAEWALQNLWFNYADAVPPLGVEVIAQSDEWIHPDFNPKGIRVGFQNLTEDRNDAEFQFLSAHWYDYQDTYQNDEKTFPVKWKFIQ